MSENFTQGPAGRLERENELLRRQRDRLEAALREIIRYGNVSPRVYADARAVLAELDAEKGENS